jgi:hypothetical protein
VGVTIHIERNEMPDISMCHVKSCTKSKECYRSEDSGTEPSKWRQSWIIFPEDHESGDKCLYFWTRK